jgi:Protein of unknown function (DUF2786)
MSRPTTRSEKIRKLRALARSPNRHEAALALEMAEKLESKYLTARGVALAIEPLFSKRGLKVRVRRYRTSEPYRNPVDVEVRYRRSRASYRPPGVEIMVTEYEGGKP